MESIFLLLLEGGCSFEAKLFGPILVRQRSEDVREEDGEWKGGEEYYGKLVAINLSRTNAAKLHSFQL